MSKNVDATTLPPGPAMRAMLQRIATGPDLSKPLNEAEAEFGMRLILNGECDPVQAGIFLIALRMKRETPAENRGVLSAIRKATRTATVAVDDLVDLADPYNGYVRTLPSAPFLPAVLSACGVPCASHGVFSMGPKFGATHAQVLAAAGIDTNLDPQHAATQVAGAAGWAYVDQSVFCPELANLQALRTRIVKRPVITTVEVLARPLIAAGRSHLVTGYVHKPYPPVYTMLARHVGLDSCLLLRGTEGGVVPSLRQSGRAVFYHGTGEDIEINLEPEALGIQQTLRAAQIPEDVLTSGADDGLPDGPDFSVSAMARAAADAGLAALSSAPGPIRDGLIYSGALVLQHVRGVAAADAAMDVRRVLDDGTAKMRFEDAARIA